MPHVVIAHVPGQDLDDYQAVADAVGPDAPEGLLVLAAGAVEGALHIVNVFASRAHADRFQEEHLLPALQRTGRGPVPDTTFVAFDTDIVTFGDAASSEPAR